MEFVETLKVNANYLSLYDTVIDAPQKNVDGCRNFVDTFHDCNMSAAAVKSIKKAVNVILYLTRQRHYKEARKKCSCTGFRQNDVKVKNKYLCTFLTLTLPAKQTHTDEELTKYCINPFLSYARKYFGVRYYVWKKELQKNGNLHYHFVTDRFIDAQCLRRCWNRILNRGPVPGVSAPFDYVTRYHNKMIERYADGWNINKMWDIVKESQTVRQTAEENAAEMARKLNRPLQDLEINTLYVKAMQAEYRRMHAVYLNEMKEPNEAKRFINPNSTDISKIESPKTISAYVAKYIAKDMDNDDLALYQQKVAEYKRNLIFCSRQIYRKLQEGETVTELDNNALNYWRALLDKERENCPIKGKLWFKSATLTPFLDGACEFIHRELDSELRRLFYYLDNLGKKKGKNFIVRSYEMLNELNEDGTPKKGKCICVTLLCNIFQLQMLKRNGKLQFPNIVNMWRRFVYDCITTNRKRGLYEREDKNFAVLTKINENAVTGIK